VRALIVEQEGIIALDLSKRLSDLGYEVTTIEQLDNKIVERELINPPDVVIYDVSSPTEMTDPDPAEVIQRFSTDPLPVVFLTSESPGELSLDGSVCYRLFLKKPFSDNDLYRCLEDARKYRTNNI